jgi:hypothetical protein
MKRLSLFEFEDFDWLPDVIRRGVTNLVGAYHRLASTSEILSNLILSIHKKHAFTHITDLGSGSGGPMLDVIDKINHTKNHPTLHLLLTDLHPNAKFIKQINGAMEHVKYHEHSVDATNIADVPHGLKTMIASFHHMKPEVAIKILRGAQDRREPILIYELMKNTIPVVLWILLLPLSMVIMILMSLVMTPFIRPLTFSQLFFTFVVPIIPLVYAWDGQASIMRTYTFEDIHRLLEASESNEYNWVVSDAKNAKGRNAGYYIMGYPLS